MILFIKHVEIEGPETLGAFFAEQGYSLGVVNLHNRERLPDLKGVEAVVSLGGPMNVYEEDKYPFLKEEDIFLKKVLAARVPFLGICLGSQLLAKAAGGSVVRSSQPEVGWFDIQLTPEGMSDPLLKYIPSVCEVYQWHGDMCVPPEGAVHLARSARCPMQAFRYGSNAYGLQFHAEITDKSIADWSDADGLPAARKQEMLQHYLAVKNVFDARGRVLCENFLTIMKGN